MGLLAKSGRLLMGLIEESGKCRNCVESMGILDGISIVISNPKKNIESENSFFHFSLPIQNLKKQTNTP